MENLKNLKAEETFALWYFDYDYKRRFHENAEALARCLAAEKFAAGSIIDLVGHSKGGLVARMAVLGHELPLVRRIVTLATPNHGALNGIQLHLLAQMAIAAAKQIHPLYARARGILDLNKAYAIMMDAIATSLVAHPERINGKSYVSIPALYYNSKRQFGDPPPSLMMGGVTLFIKLCNSLARRQLMAMKPVHDGIVEERSNQLFPSPRGSTSEASYMPSRTDASERMLHTTHEAADVCDHTTITSKPEIAELVLAVLLADQLQEEDIDPHLSHPIGRVQLRPRVE